MLTQQKNGSCCLFCCEVSFHECVCGCSCYFCFWWCIQLSSKRANKLSNCWSMDCWIRKDVQSSFLWALADEIILMVTKGPSFLPHLNFIVVFLGSLGGNVVTMQHTFLIYVPSHPCLSYVLQTPHKTDWYKSRLRPYNRL